MWSAKALGGVRRVGVEEQNVCVVSCLQPQEWNQKQDSTDMILEQRSIKVLKDTTAERHNQTLDITTGVDKRLKKIIVSWSTLNFDNYWKIDGKNSLYKSMNKKNKDTSYFEFVQSFRFLCDGETVHQYKVGSLS